MNPYTNRFARYAHHWEQASGNRETWRRLSHTTAGRPTSPLYIEDIPRHHYDTERQAAYRAMVCAANKSAHQRAQRVKSTAEYNALLDFFGALIWYLGSSKG